MAAKFQTKKEYEGITKQFTASGAATTDWDDTKLLALENCDVSLLDVDSMAALVKNLLPRLETGISERNAAQIINVAWNIQAPGKNFERLFPSTSSLHNALSKNIDLLDDTPIGVTSVASKIVFPASNLAICQAGGFICASLLRLFTKSPENYVNAQTEIIKAYNKFYETDFPITSFKIRESVINKIHLLFQNRPLYKNTLAHLIYYVNDIVDNSGILILTFELHIQNTGMHCWPMFQEVCGRLNADTGKMLTALDISQTNRAIKCIVTLITEFEADTGILKAANRTKKTYKYARLFDRNMFADLQTKNCQPLALTLAFLRKMTTSKGTGDVMKIVALKDIDQGVKDIYQDFAREIHGLFGVSMESANNNPLFEKVVVKHNP